MCCSQWCEQPVCSCRECRHAGVFFFLFFSIYSSVPVEAACRRSSSSILNKCFKSPFACMCVGGCDTDLYVPFLSMTSCASLALSLSLSLSARSDRDGVSTLSREQPERRDLGENSLSQWGAERARVFPPLHLYTQRPGVRACVRWLCRLTWHGRF